MRRYGIENSYEALKELTRGQRMDKDSLHRFIDSLDLPDAELQRLKALTPESYLGLAEKLATEI
jgi:adenylosuccinate lyase